MDEGSNGDLLYSGFSYEGLKDNILPEQNKQGSIEAIVDKEDEGLFGMGSFDINGHVGADFRNNSYERDTNGEQFDETNNGFIGQSMNLNIPGGFMTYDSMELDDSPPFTIESQPYHDTALELDSKVPDIPYGNSDVNLNMAKSEVDETNRHHSISMYGRSRSSSIQVRTPDRIFQNDSSKEYDEGYVDGYQKANNRNHSNSIGNSNFFLNNINKNSYHDLSPLTTTTSLTPSVNSIHSTQPSFFSAHQYLTRNSLDQPPSQSLHRPSFDLYSNGKSSIDNQQTSRGQRNQVSSGRYTSFTNSITNYIPFMNGSQRSPDILQGSESVPSPQHFQNYSNITSQTSQPRNKIKNIFKSSAAPSSNNENNDTNRALNGNNYDSNGNNANFNSFTMTNDINTSDFLVLSPSKEDMEAEMDGELTRKKARKPKRSLFTRFKAPIKTDPMEELEAFKNDDGLRNPNEASSIEHNSSAQASSLNHSISSSMAAGNSNGGFTDMPNSTNTFISSGNMAQEPDYAALFENVGKRKNIVNSGTYNKSWPKSKVENQTNSLNSANNLSSHNSEKSFVVNFNLNSTNKKSGEHNLESNLSGSSSNTSSFNNSFLLPEAKQTNSTSTTTNSNNTSSSIASASKRILGSKLMLKKKNEANADISEKSSKSDMDVEVDLKSLDLPPTTQIFPSAIINSKTRVRGRKENKEADMVDQSKIYLCNYCSRRFKRQEHLKRHFRSLHTFEKPFDCTICQKKFSRADNLGQHLKIHKQEEENAKNGVKSES